MQEPIEKTPSLEEKTISIAETSGFGGLINEVSQRHNLTDYESQFKIPLPIEKIEKKEGEFKTSPETSNNIQTLLEMINETETAVEFPFLLTGNLKNIDKIDFLYEKFEELKSTEVEMNSKLLGSAVASANKENKNVYILGHTHPNIPEDEKSKILANQISKEVKEKYGIKDPGLNVPLQDLYQLIFFQEAVKSWVKEDSKIYLTLLMYDGTMEAMSIENGKVKKTSILYK